MDTDEFRKARAELARAAQLSSIRDSHDPTLTIAIDVIDELLRQSDVYQAAVPAESAVEATLIAYHGKWGQPWPPDPELFGEIGAAEIEAIRETMCAALTAAGIHIAEAAAPTGTEWFWEIVDRNGLGDVPSDERGALSRLVRLAEAAGRDRALLVEMRDAEQQLSDAYIRLRALIPGAFDTPHGPSPETIWSHTEGCLRKLVADSAEAVAAEREACAKIAEAVECRERIEADYNAGLNDAARHIAATIRARQPGAKS